MKKGLFLLILVLQCWATNVRGLEVPRLRGYVNDYAGMISPSAKARMEEQLRAFEGSDSTQIVVLTVAALDGEPIEAFSIRVAEAWKIGQRGKDNGVLFIVSKQDRKIRVEVGRGLEGKLTDLMAGRIVDQVIKPRFKQGDFDGGFLAGVSALIDGARGEFKADQKPSQRQQKGFPPALTLVLFLGVFTLILGSLSRILGGMTGAVGLPAVVHLAALPVGIVATLLLALIGFGLGLVLPSLFSSTSSQRNGRRLRGGESIFGPGGGSSWHTSGGSDSGGDFSGGGGSFGGGGASGDW